MKCSTVRRHASFAWAVPAASVILLTGCNNAVEGGLSGAAIGAGSGAAIGAIAAGGTGAWMGAAAGAIGGGVVGAVIGDQNARREAMYQPGTGAYNPR